MLNCKHVMLSTVVTMAATSMGIAHGAQDAAWPTHPVTIVVPYAPGGNTDTMARLIGNELSTRLSVPFVVENRAGAAGIVATESVAQAAPDGYTLLMGTLTQISTAPFTNKIKYDPIKDFIPVANVGGNPFVITVNSKVPAKNISELIALAKAKPHTLNVGNAGVGGLTHLSALVFASRADIDVVEVSYRGAAPALADVLAGHIDLYSGSLSEVLPHKTNPQVRLLGVSSKERIDALPDVPALGEILPGIPVVETWNGLLAPAGTPDAIVKKIADNVLAAQKTPKFAAKLAELGITPLPEATAAFSARIRKDVETWEPILKAAGVSPQ